MALIQYGELLSVTSEIVPGTVKYDAFESKRVVVFDKDAGKAAELQCGKNFPQEEFLRLKNSERQQVALVVTFYGGKLYVESIAEIGDKAVNPGARRVA